MMKYDYKKELREQEQWGKAALKAYRAGDYKKALELIAWNPADNGSPEAFIQSFCNEARPLPEWRKAL